MLRSPLRLFVFTLTLSLPLLAGADCMGPYPPSLVKAFNQNCAKDMLPFCGCVMDKVERSIPLADFIEISNTGDISKDARFIKASKECSATLQGGASVSPAPASAVPAGQTMR